MIVLGFGDVLLRVCVCGNSLKYHVEVFKLFVFIYFHQDYNLTFEFYETLSVFVIPLK